MKVLFITQYWAFALLLFLVEQARCDSSTAPAVASKSDKEKASPNPPPVCIDDLGDIVINDLIDWIKENGGFVDGRQHVERDCAGSITAQQNVVATSFIPKGTVLLTVPWDLVVEPKDYDDEDERSLCNMVKVLHQELEANKQGESEYGPYMRYLESLANPFMLPTTWSQGGKNLLRQVMGENLMTDVNEMDREFRRWKKECVRGQIANNPEEKAAYLVIGYDSPNPSDGEQEWFQLIPYYDFYDPREDGDYNVDFVQDEEEEVMLVITKRDIQAGEKIHTPMNFGEAGAGGERQFIHSGRVERRHVFSFTDKKAPPKNQDMDVEFDVDKVEENGKSVYNVTWAEGLRPHSRAYDEIEKELNRMKKIVTLLPQDALYSLLPVKDHERKAIGEYALALIDALSALLETKLATQPVTPWTLRDYEVGGVNIGSYNLEGVEEEKEPEKAEPYELFEDFDIGDMIIGNENWKDMIEYRRKIERPTVSFYVDKVARKRWLPTKGMPQATQHVLKYGFELTENGDKDKEADALYKLIPDEADYAAKPSHHSEGVSVWLVSHDKESNITSFSSTARQLKADEDNPFDKMNVAKSLTKHLHAEAAEDESWILRNVKPGVVVEERFVEVDKFDRAPIEFSCFVIWGRVWVAQMNNVEGDSRYALTWLRRDGTPIAGKDERPPKELEYVDYPLIVEIAETLGRNKDMFRVDIFVGLPASSPSLKGNATLEERLDDIEYAVNECEIYPTTSFRRWPQLAQDGARLWVAGYKMGNYRTVPNNEIPKEFLENGGSLPELYGIP